MAEGNPLGLAAEGGALGFFFSMQFVEAIATEL